MKTIYIAGGCFWGVEKYFSMVKGVLSTEVGYANGTKDYPNYEDLKHGIDNASETVKIEYDENVLSLEKILELFLRFVDPYSLNKQGEDEGIQYRSGVYFVDINDETRIRAYFDKYLEKNYKIEISPLNKFLLAEEYHQNYLDKNPHGYCHINFGILKEEEKN